jgi:hypothetical protein
VPRDNEGTEINSAFRRYQFDVETEVMIAAKHRAVALGKTFRIYLRDLIRADLEGVKTNAKKK